MERMTFSFTKQLLVALGCSCICATAGLAQSAGPSGLGSSMAAYQFDGIYKGTTQRISANTESCRPGQEVAVDVQKGRLKLPWNDPQVFDAAIARDGSFFATIGSVVQAEKHMTTIPTLQGQIKSTGLVADYGTRWCRYRLEARLPPTEQHFSERTQGGVTGR